MKRSWIAACTLALAAAMFASAQPASAGTPPSGFQDNVIFSGLEQPTAVSASPDGRFFVAEKSGLIKVYDGVGDATASTFADLRTEVHNFSDRGLLGMTLDPQFPADPYVYVLYTRDAVPGGNSPRYGQAGQSSDPCPNSTGQESDACLVTGRLSRLTASGNVMSGQTTLITDWCQQYSSHSIGDLDFGPDGALYVSAGDGASYTFADWGQAGAPTPNPCGDPPNPAGTALSPPTAEGGALRSQDARPSFTSDPTGLNGTILRVDPDTGAGLSGNPFFGSGDANLRRIVAMGLRNPYRFTIRPGTEEVWIGDVGWVTWEEINRIVDPTDSTADNFGWPCYEGSDSGSARQSGYDGANLNLCETLYSGPSSGRVAPHFAYEHWSDIIDGENCPDTGSATSGLAFYPGGPFPDTYDGALFFADYGRGCIWVMRPGTGGLPSTSNIQVFDTGAGYPVDLEISPGGDLFYADIGFGEVRRISYPQGNSPPNAVATATPSNGAAPLTTTLSAAGSTDPNGDSPLTYAWDLDGDGQFDDDTRVNFQHTYTQPGTFNPAVRVSDPGGASDTDSVQVQVNNTPPNAQITAPTASTTWGVGDTVPFSGSATDAQQTLPASAFDWRVVIQHGQCPSNCHDHVQQTLPDRTSGSFSAPDHDYPSSLRIELTVTDSGGLTDFESVTIDPRTVQLTFNSSPSGLQIAVGPSQSTTPFTRTVIEDSQNSVSAPTPQTLGGSSYDFQSWSDGGAASHNIVADQSKTLTATYASPPAPPTINDTDPNSPSNDNDPEVKGTTGAGSPTQVKIYTNGTCSGAAAATGTPAQFSGTGITVAVTPNATTQLSARTSNGVDSTCSGSFSYTEDSTAPAAPSITDTDPNSPANETEPLVKGSTGSGSPTQVKLYTNGTCTGSPATTGTPGQFSGAGITGVEVPEDTTTQLSARTTDAVGNDSSCSGAYSYTEDSTPPTAPEITDTDPNSPAADNTPAVKGIVGAGSNQVELYANGACSGSPAATGSPAQFTGAGITVTVTPNATTQLSVLTSDQAGNDSPCSPAHPYTDDSSGPAAPTINDTDPNSPSNDSNPEVKGTTGAGSPTQVKIYTNGSCTGTAAATGTPAEFSGAGITVAVPSDQTTQLSARTSDAVGNDSGCSASYSYTEDSTGPAAPVITDTDPNSPSSDSSPEVKGTTGGGSPTQVKIYTNGTCTGTPAATGTPAQFTGGGITVAVSPDQTTQLSARSTDAIGNDSSCSASYAYTEDSTPPAAPSISDTDPDSPANDNDPEVKGSAEAGSTVRLYESASCGGTAEDTDSAAAFASPGLTALVDDDDTVQFTVRATDAAGNVSPCSGVYSYTEDSTGPEPPAITDTDPDSPSSDNEPEVKGAIGAGSPTEVQLFTNPDCSGSPVATASPGQFASPGITVSVPPDVTTQLSALASDVIGHDSACSLPFSYTEVSTVPGLAPPVLGDVSGVAGGGKKKCRKKRDKAKVTNKSAAKKCKKSATAKR